MEYYKMEKLNKQRNLKKLHIDLPKIPHPASSNRSLEKQNLQTTQINLQLSPKLKNLRKLFFQYRSNAQILQHSPYYISNTKNRHKMVEMISSRRYDLSEQIENEIFEKYGWIEESPQIPNIHCLQQKTSKKILNVTLNFQSRQYPVTINCLTSLQLKKKLTHQLARIMYSLKSSYKRLQLLVGFETTSEDHELDFILANPNIDMRQFKKDSFSLKPIILSQNRIPKRKVNLTDFKFIKCLGNGGFSTVYLVKCIFDGKYYAMKMINKKFIVDSERQGIVENQRYILGQLHSSLVTGLEFAFQTKNHFILVVQYCPGGQLFYQLKKVKRMTEKQAKFYFLEILCGLDYIHSKNIVYRDLKPQNLLIGIDGHIKIADFGLSKPIQTREEKSFSFCGSPEYMAPEMLLKTGHTKMLDYYCLGALLYQLVVGVPPYYSLNHQEIYDSILNEELNFPDYVELTDQLKSMLRSLLQKNSKKRLGCMFGIKEILAHPWVGKIKQTLIENKGLQPPFIPDLQKFNFDMSDIKSDLEQINHLIEQDTKTQSNFETFFSDEFYFERPQWRHRVQKLQKVMEEVKTRPKKMLKKSRSVQNNLNQSIERRNQSLGQTTRRQQSPIIRVQNFGSNTVAVNQTARLLRKVRSSKGFNLTTMRK